MSDDKELPIWDHLDELARRLRRILVSVAVATIVMASLPADLARIAKLDFSNYRPMISIVMEVIQDTLLPEGVNLIAFTWLDTFYIYVIVSIALGTLISLPVIAYEIYQFVSPAMFSQERRYVFSFVTVFSILFLVGAIYAYFILLPITFKILLRFVNQTRIAPFFILPRRSRPMRPTVSAVLGTWRVTKSARWSRSSRSATSTPRSRE